MAFLSSLAVQIAKNNTQAVAQSLMVDKKTVASLSSFIRDNTKKHWKPVAGAFFLGTCVYGAIKIRSEILATREELKIRPTSTEVENLAHTVNVVGGNCGLERAVLGEFDSLADEFLLSLDNEKELEDCLENDPAASENVKWFDATKEDGIIDLEIKRRKYELGTQDKEESDEESTGVKSKKRIIDPIIAGLKTKKVLVAQEAYHKEQYRKQRKRVRSGQFGSAIRSLSAKIRASFPLPDGSMLQQKAMCLYAAKECRKMCIREAQIAALVPKAVALASIPTTSQVDLRQITKIEAVELKYKKMAWSGYKNKQGWASHLAKLFA